MVAVNANDRICLRRARGMLTLLAGARSARQAWSLVASIAELDRSYGRIAASKAVVAWGHRPCARVGLKTKPFRIARTSKGPLSRCGRIIGGHRRLVRP